MARYQSYGPRLAVAVLLLVLCCAGCSGRGHRGAEGSDAAGPIYSPNGEVLSGGPLGHPSCEAAMSNWFERVDADHDGSIDLNEFLVDTRRQFAVMDRDKDGYITPDELADYRAPYLYPEARSSAAEAAPSPEGAEEKRGRRSGEGSNFAAKRGRGDDANDQPDPVMSADVKLRNRVSLADFIAYARQEFAALDLKHDGHLSLREVQNLCQARQRP